MNFFFSCTHRSAVAAMRHKISDMQLGAEGKGVHPRDRFGKETLKKSKILQKKRVCALGVKIPSTTMLLATVHVCLVPYKQTLIICLCASSENVSKQKSRIKGRLLSATSKLALGPVYVSFKCNITRIKYHISHDVVIDFSDGLQVSESAGREMVSSFIAAQTKTTSKHANTKQTTNTCARPSSAFQRTRQQNQHVCQSSC